MPKKSSQPTAYPALDLNTFKHFFCLNFDGLFSDPPAQIKPEKFKELITCILEGIRAHEEKARWEKSLTSADTTIKVKMTPNGSFFIHTQYTDNGVPRHQLISGIYSTVTQNGVDIPRIEPHSVFCGFETENKSGQWLAPSICLSRTLLAEDDDESELIPARDESEFYAFACYARHILATCATDSPIDLDINMVWFGDETVEGAKDVFVGLLETTSLEELQEEYHSLLRVIKSAYESAMDPDAELDGDDDLDNDPGPHSDRHLH